QAIIREALRINQEITHYDFALLYLEQGHRSFQLVEKLKKEGNHLVFLKKMHVLGRILNLDKVAYSEGLKIWEKAVIKLWGSHKVPSVRLGGEFYLETLNPAEINQAMNLLNSYSEKIDLARFWVNQSEVDKELNYPGVSNTLSVKRDGQLVGILNYLEHEHLGRTSERWAWLNHLYLDSLKVKEKARIINGFLKYLSEQGIIGVIEWNKGYYPQSCLYRSRFFPYFRYVNLYAWVFNPELFFSRIKSIYEVQI
ncbi:MAG: hypothetical protein RBR88_05700, partial [Candidatus Saccharicenans sp.]|nr:hypothetical protein [Candidatus Saccharicenans sp.]